MAESGPIPFANGLAAGLDRLSGASPEFTNFIPDAAGGLMVRPGIEPWEDFPDAPVDSPVIGIFNWRQYILFVTEDRQIWAWLSSGLVQALSDATAATRLDGTGRPVWTYDSDRVVVTGGGAPQQWQGVGLSSRLAPAAVDPSGMPLKLTHIAYSAQRFIGNVNSNAGILQWTPPGPGSHTSWPIVGPFYSEAEASPDPVVAVFANTNEVYAFGTQTLQVYQPDPTIAFAVAASKQVGCSAVGSIIEVDDDGFAWLDDKRQFVMSNGRSLEIISRPQMAADISRFSTVSDCIGSRLRIGPCDLLVWQFPTEKRGPFFDLVTKKWGEIRSLGSNGEWQSWIANCHYYWSDQNLHLIGLSNGTIGVLTFEASDDNGQTIKAVSDTGFIDRGTFLRKGCERVQLQFRRGQTAPPAAAPVVELSWRDDLGAFGPAERWSMGAAEYQPVVNAWGCGMYEQREYRLTWTGGGNFFLAGATESFVLSDT